jgi:hypothetical protein
MVNGLVAVLAGIGNAADNSVSRGLG